MAAVVHPQNMEMPLLRTNTLDSEASSVEPSSPPLPSPATVVGAHDAEEAQFIVSQRWRRAPDSEQGGEREFLVSWKGRPIAESTWEPEDLIRDASLIEQFEAARAAGGTNRPSPVLFSPSCSMECAEGEASGEDSPRAVIDDADSASALTLMALLSARPVVRPPPLKARKPDPVPYGAYGLSVDRRVLREDEETRQASNRKRRANEDERIRHFGWTMVKVDGAKKGGSAGAHCWVHPVHGTATSKKAVFRFHSNEAPVKKTKVARDEYDDEE